MKKKFLKLIVVSILSSSMFSLAIPAYGKEVNETTTTNQYTEEISVSSEDEEIVDIPDENLKRAINIQLGKSEDSDLTKGELKLITKLDVSNSNITSLKGLEYCGNLISLNISHNSVIDLSPLEGLDKIADLNLSYNKITDITPVKGLKNLAHIDTTENAIGNLDILDGLLKFDINADSNKTTDISISDDLKNGIFDIDVSKDSNIDLDLSSILDDFFPENGGSSSNNPGSNSSSSLGSSNLGSGLLNVLGKVDLSNLLGSLNPSSSFGSSSLSSLSSLGSKDSSLLSSSSILTDSSNTKSASSLQTGDKSNLSGIVTLAFLSLASLVSLIVTRKKKTLEN